MTLRSLRALLPIFALLGAALPLLAGGFDAVLGVWDCAAITPDGDQIPAVVEVREEGSGLAVLVTLEEVKRPASAIKVDGKSFSFSVLYQSEPYAIEGRIEGDALTGTWSGAGMSGEFKGSRRR